MGPAHQRVPAWVRISRATTFSSVLPERCAVAPHALLPSMPPSAQWLWVEGRGPNSRPYGASCAFSSSRTMPGSTRHVCASASTEINRLQYFVQSMTTATLVHCPPRLVPPPRGSTGAPCRAHTSIAAAPASTLRGTTTPIGTCR
ncbi:hypothetical protein BH708_05960 [Brachybacterium sp. P6-10-X1]|nr:hypothetical protein BH708_05960 [Brachybacterium sp. P6-10-X1]